MRITNITSKIINIKFIYIEEFMGRKIILTEEQEKIVKDSYLSGMSCNQILKNTGFGRDAIKRCLVDAGIYNPDKTRYRKYSDEDIEYIKKYYQIGDWDSIFKKYPFMNKQNVYDMAKKRGFSADFYFWRKEDELIVKENMYSKTFEEISDLIDNRKSSSQVKQKAFKLGYRNDDSWTEEEINILKKNYSLIPMIEIMKLLPRHKTKDCIQMKASQLNLKSYYSLNCMWTDDEKDFIKNNWKSMSDIELADKLKRSQRNVKYQRERLGLFRSDPFGEINNRLNDYLRGRSYTWRKNSINACNNKCVLTGSEKFDVHHIYPVNQIISDILYELNLENKNLDEYTSKELEIIVTKFNEKQNKYLGVCVRQDIHNLFHSIYGDIATKDQWEQFVIDFKNNKFADYIAA